MPIDSRREPTIEELYERSTPRYLIEGLNIPVEFGRKERLRTDKVLSTFHLQVAAYDHGVSRQSLAMLFADQSGKYQQKGGIGEVSQVEKWSRIASANRKLAFGEAVPFILGQT